VTHLFTLGLEVALVGGLGGNLGGDALGDGDSCEFEGFDFGGVVGDEADGVDAELLEDLCRELKLAGSRPCSRELEVTSMVSSPWSWSSYARSLAISPMPRPSCCS
jgi:hypothetical protein